MTLNHNEYLDYTLPNEWCAEEDEDTLLLYNPDGNGAITMSFYNVLDMNKSAVEHASQMAKRFVDYNEIELHSPFVLFQKEGKTILYGTGTEPDGGFMKLWIVAKYPKIVLASYHSEQESDEVTACDSVIDSFRFTF